MHIQVGLLTDKLVSNSEGIGLTPSNFNTEFRFRHNKVTSY